METQEIRRYFVLLLRWLWLILLCAALGGGAAYLVSRRMTPVYSASTTLLIRQAPSAGTTDYTALLTSERLAQTYSKMIAGRPVMEAVVAELGLATSPADLAKQVSVELVRDTQLIRVSVEDTSPSRAAGVANAVAAAFAAQNRSMQAARYADSLDGMQREMQGLSALIAETQAQIDALGAPKTGDGQAELARLQTILAGHRNTYSLLLQNYEQMRLTAAQSADDVAVYESAQVPGAPVRPRTRQNALLAAAVGAMLAVGVAFLVEYLDDTLKTPDDVRHALGLETLGIIGQIKGEEKELVVATQPRSAIAEAYRVLRTNVRFSSLDRPLHTLLVTSPGPTEGKSITAANLASTMAEAGLTVVAVDADLRRPRQHRLFDIDRLRGLTQALLDGRVDGNVHPTLYMGKLGVLPAGELPPNPSEILGSQRMRDLLAELAGQADLVIVDSPPSLPVTDAAVLARQVDGVLLVIEAGQTRRWTAQRALEGLQQVGGNVIGVVLNNVPTTGIGSRYYYYYYYREYYGDGEEGTRRVRRRQHRGLLGRLLGRRRPRPRTTPSGPLEIDAPTGAPAGAPVGEPAGEAGPAGDVDKGDGQAATPPERPGRRSTGRDSRRTAR